jgi:hypothetical protein
MISKRIQRHVANATVTILKTGGQGVLIKNGFIVTAAHCIEFKCDGSMVSGDYFIEEIETIHGKFKVSPWAVEPVNDIAILGPLDGQVFPDEELGFEEFCEKVKPIPLFLAKLKQFEKFPIYVYTHKKTWLEGEATKWSPEKDSPSIGIDYKEQIEGGTSGSPIINERGELVGIVSNASIKTPGFDKCKGTAPRPHLALPIWISRSIRRGRFEYDQFTSEESEKIRESMMQERG